MTKRLPWRHRGSTLRRSSTSARKRRRLRQRAAKNTFRAYAEPWAKAQKWDRRTRRGEEARLRNYVYPKLGSPPLASIEESDVRALALDIRDTGKFRQAQKVLGLVTATLDDAVLEKLITRNVAKDVPRKLLRGGDRVKNFAAIDSPVEFGHLLRAIDGYGGNVVTRYALQFSALTFQRPGEVRGARWEEFENLDDESTALWRIPAERMKVRQQHLVAS